ncbi:MAG: type 1 glutamine amidotransferase domain-containing protein [Pseudomonadota bacterium]
MKKTSTSTKKNLGATKVAVLLCDGFEESEMTKPRAALKKAGAKVYLISPGATKVKGWTKGKWSKAYKVDFKLEKANPNQFHALLLPGGVMNPDQLRANKKAVNFVNHFMKKKKPVAAICHGPLTLIETNTLKGRRLTSYNSIKTDLKNAGATWQDKEVIVDRNLVTSRKPKDIPAFNKAMIKRFSKIKTNGSRRLKAA